MPISKPMLPIRQGYVEKENRITKERYYEKISDPSGYYTKTVIIKQSELFKVPESKNQIFQIELIGGGASYKNSIKGSDGNMENKELILAQNDEIYISIGPAGFQGSNGGTTSFGEFFYALGGVSGQEECTTITHNDNYGKGGTENSDATDGVCIIIYQAPVYL